MTTAPAGRFAPSPSGDLHFGNLRTALLAWLFARSSARRFILRFDDLDRVFPGAVISQQHDLRAIGLDWDGPEYYQSHQLSLYRDIINELQRAGLTYECYCTRREILEAPQAPHAPQGAYPGTCKELSNVELQRHRAKGRPPALRLRSTRTELTVPDLFYGEFTGVVDDFVLQRGDGVPSYNFTVVVDDATHSVNQIVRGDDLLASTPRQAYLYDLLNYPAPQYIHVPLAVNSSGIRLAKRDGAVTLSQLHNRGYSSNQVLALLGDSLNLCQATENVTAAELLTRFNPIALNREPWIFIPPKS